MNKSRNNKKKESDKLKKNIDSHSIKKFKIMTEAERSQIQYRESTAASIASISMAVFGVLVSITLSLSFITNKSLFFSAIFLLILSIFTIVLTAVLYKKNSKKHLALRAFLTKIIFDGLESSFFNPNSINNRRNKNG